ncbi:MAG: GNAT family N-acetyltransferase [Cyanobacteria bacterium REEB67]|nr:GNAT family N-acetyltransferase [Cyanobacteria bacterium REEB67]
MSQKLETIKTFRVATPADAAGCREIYAPFCAADSPVSFELEPPSEAEMARRIASTLETLPWLVAVGNGGKILGYAYASPHMARPAYRWSVNVSIYLHPDARRQGLGSDLYKRLFAILRDLGYYNAYAGITLPNDGSLSLHRHLDFLEVGVYERVGYKCGAWHDVAWWGLALQNHPDVPAEPVPFPSFVASRGSEALLALLA